MHLRRQTILILFFLLIATLWSVPLLSAGPIEPRVFLPLITIPSNTPIPFGDVINGSATYYREADGSGNCLFDPLPEPQFVGAMNDTDYNAPLINGVSYPNATLCGAYARITGAKGTAIIQIVDRCPECPPGHIDLSPEAFAAIDEIPLGYVPLTWQLLSPPLTEPIRFRYKDGSSQWWAAVQVSRHRNPVASLEVKQSDGSFVALPRQQWNYFVAAAGLGPGLHTFRVTDIFGNRLIEMSKVPLGTAVFGTTVDWVGEGQFPPPN